MRSALPLTRLIPGWIGLGAIGAVLAVSCLSGFHAGSTPFAIRWQFSPLGLLGGLGAESAALRSQPTFVGTLGWNWDYAVVFLKTCVLEAPFYLLALRPLGRQRACAGLILANFLTHPVVFFVFPILFKRYLFSLLGAELFAAVTESALVFRWRSGGAGRPRRWSAAFLILAANLFSWQIGALLP